MGTGDVWFTIHTLGCVVQLKRLTIHVAHFERFFLCLVTIISPAPLQQLHKNFDILACVNLITLFPLLSCISLIWLLLVHELLLNGGNHFANINLINGFPIKRCHILHVKQSSTSSMLSFNWDPWCLLVDISIFHLALFVTLQQCNCKQSPFC